jgi:uncharacterized protein
MNNENQSLPPPIPPAGGTPPIVGGPGEIPPPAKGPWGFWATIGWTIVILLTYFIVEALVYRIGTGVSTGFGTKPDMQKLQSDSRLLSLGLIGAAPAAIGLSMFFAHIRKGPTLLAYLAIRLPTWQQTILWAVVLSIFLAAFDTLSHFLGKPVVTQWMVDLYSHAQSLPLLWLAIVVAAPLSEEFIFRGFLLTGIQRSRAGAVVAIILSAVLWASIHAQYDLYGIAMVFFVGLLLGYARIRSGSLLLCIFLHSLMNLIATLQVHWHLVRLGR